MGHFHNGYVTSIPVRSSSDQGCHHSHQTIMWGCVKLPMKLPYDWGNIHPLTIPAMT